MCCWGQSWCRFLPSINLALDLVLVEIGGDHLAASFSPELMDLWIDVVDVAARAPPRGGALQWLSRMPHQQALSPVSTGREQAASHDTGTRADHRGKSSA